MIVFGWSQVTRSFFRKREREKTIRIISTLNIFKCLIPNAFVIVCICLSTQNSSHCFFLRRLLFCVSGQWNPLTIEYPLMMRWKEKGKKRKVIHRFAINDIYVKTWRTRLEFVARTIIPFLLHQSIILQSNPRVKPRVTSQLMHFPPVHFILTSPHFSIIPLENLQWISSIDFCYCFFFQSWFCEILRISIIRTVFFSLLNDLCWVMQQRC